MEDTRRTRTAGPSSPEEDTFVIKDAVQCLVAAAISTLLIVTAALVLDGDQRRAHPDRDDTRVERVVDVQLPTL